MNRFFKYLIKLTSSIAVLFILTSSAFANAIKQDGFEYHIKPVPDWVESVIPPSEVSQQNNAGAVWVLSDNQTRMIKNEYSRFLHFGVKVNLENGLKEASEISIYFQPDFQTLDINYVKRHREGNTSNLTNQVDIRLLQREESYSQGIYDGGVTAMLLIPDVQVGDKIEYAYTVNGRNPIFENEYFSGFPLNWSVPVEKIFTQLITDKELNFKLYNAEQKYLNKTLKNDLIYYRWEQTQVPAVYDESEYPVWFDPYASIRFSQYDSWAGVVDWAKTFYQIEKIKNKKLIKLSDKWAKESSTKKQYAEKVIRYAQNNIRYFGIEIGQNSHRPYSPDVVFERKYGDCKDKTMFINTLLARQGISAYPALVSSRTTKLIKDLVPQPGAFDHVISTFELEGKQYWVDGTREFQFGDLEHIGISNFEVALVVKEGSQDLQPINVELKVNEMQLDEQYVSKSYDKPVKLTATFKYFYARAEGMRSFLNTEGFSNFSKSFRNFYAKQYPSVKQLKDVKIIDDEAKNHLTVIADFEIPDYWKKDKAVYELPMYGDIIADYIRKPSIIAREMPLANAYPAKVRHSISIKYDDSVNWNIDDRKLVVESDELFYQRVINLAENEVKVTHEFESRSDAVDVENVAQYINDTNRIRNALYYALTIDNETFKSESSQDLKMILKALLKKNRE